MSTSAYTVELTDVGVQSLGGLSPRLTVRPAEAAYGPGNVLVSDHRVEVVLSGSSGAMTLIPSSELRPVTGGGLGVEYILEVSLFAKTQDGMDWEVWNTEWSFSALPGGGSVSSMGGTPPFQLIVGPPWPSTPTPGLYYDATTGDFGSYGLGG